MRARVRRIIAGGTVLVVLAAAGSVWAGIATEPATPVEGQTASVVVTDETGAPVPGTAVQAVYRPGSAVSHTEDLGTTGADGTVSWSPSSAGVVTLQTVATGDEAVLSRDLSVRFQGLPTSGALILVAAGVILYGGMIMGFRSLRSLPPELPPDT